MKKLLVVMTAVMAAMLILAAPALAVDTVDWTDWTAYSPGSVTGSIGSLTISYSGETNPPAQTSGGTNYWVPNTPYLSTLVTNAPATPDIVRLSSLNASLANEITFSAPVKDPIMAIVSLGQPGYKVSYDFNAPFDVVSYGPGYWNPPGTPGTLTELPGDVLEGEEGHGVIQFKGTFTSISWTGSPFEYWHGFTIGILKALPVAIDIKPGSDPNSINIDSNGRGVVPVAILGSASFDVTCIDPLSVKLEGAAVALKGKSGNAGSLSDVNCDGYTDLVVHIADFSVAEGSTIAKLTALTYDGLTVEGSDSIRIVPPTN